MNTPQKCKQGFVWNDPLTGLMWQVHSPGRMGWHEAMAYAQSLSLEGFRDWRLPGVAELERLLDRAQLMELTRYRAGMRSEVPFQDLKTYWTATTFKERTQNAWVIMFNGGYVLSYSKLNRYHIRCVRGCISRKSIFKA